MDIIGHRIDEFRARAFYIDNSLISCCIVLFIKIDDGRWYSLTIDDGEYSFLLEKSEHKIISLQEITDSFAYPIQKIDILDKYEGKVLKNVMEYRLINNNLCIGIYLQFDSGGLSIIESDGALSFYDAISDEIINYTQLVNLCNN
ncbi:hypothetical protein C9426_22395 [Serratia sp. S1B]|nr:hypothetical protein C9426_22395 [Serratia sp. S1B]